MSTARYKFNIFHVDRTWKDKFSDEALDFMMDKKIWLYEKLKMVCDSNSDISMDWIIIVDTAKKNNESKILMISSEHSFYNIFYNMFIKNKNNMHLGAVQNLQSENKPLKEISMAIINGENVEYDPNILFPYTKESWNCKV